MIELNGIEFPDNEYTVMIIDGEPEVMLNKDGVRRLCAHASDQVFAQEFLRRIEELDQ